MKYYISDLHLFHENAIHFDQRPFESVQQMHDTILKNWNDRVMNGDYVYILGDVSMRGKNEDLIAFVARLKGRKVLIRGNHDDVSDYRYQQLFAEICDYKEIHDSVGKEKFGLVLSHYPIFLEYETEQSSSNSAQSFEKLFSRGAWQGVMTGFNFSCAASVIPGRFVAVRRNLILVVNVG